VLARYVGNRLSESWGQSVVVDNRTGAAGVLAADALAKAAPDGYNLLVGGDGPITILPNLQKNLPYDARRDLLPVAPLGQIDFVLVAHPKTGLRSVGDFVRAAKAQPGRLNYASAGNGSALQFAMEMLKQRRHLRHPHSLGRRPARRDRRPGRPDVHRHRAGPAPHPQRPRGGPGHLGRTAQCAAAECPPWAKPTPAFGPAPGSACLRPPARPRPCWSHWRRGQPHSAQPGRPQGTGGPGHRGGQPVAPAFAQQVSTEYTRYAQIVKSAGITPIEGRPRAAAMAKLATFRLSLSAPA
jgi:hypothetical protein